MSRMNSPDGMIVVQCNAAARDVVARLENVLHARSVTVFASIDFASDAAKANLDLRPTSLVIFGNPAVGTRLMQASQQMGFDLPLKALVWSDANDETWLGYTDIQWLAKHYEITANPAVGAIASALRSIADEVSGTSPKA